MIYKTRMECSLQGRHPGLGETNGSLRLSNLAEPTYETYRDLHNRVGAPYGWDRRPRINDRSAISKLLATQGVELSEFYDGPNLVGYALTTAEKDGTAELEDFGFFPEFCGNGYGKSFLSAVLDRLSSKGVDRVWLTTRSTNHPKVISFYRGAGFEVVGEEPIMEPRPDVSCQVVSPG